jgi:hypothetical protein
LVELAGFTLLGHRPAEATGRPFSHAHRFAEQRAILCRRGVTFKADRLVANLSSLRLWFSSFKVV